MKLRNVWLLYISVAVIFTWFLLKRKVLLLSFLIIAEKVLHMQELRKQHIQEICDSDKEAFLEGKNSLEDMSRKEFDNFIVDDNYGIIYCYIPKVG